MAAVSINNLLDLSGQVAIITGASRGIGTGIAGVLREAGARLTLASRSTDALSKVADELPGDGEGVLAVTTDVSVEADVDAMVSKTMGAFGRIDILVNNAGLIAPGPYREIDPAEWHRVMGANLTGAYLCCFAVAPIMEEQKYGRIINISSISAQTGGVSGGVHYASSKGGMLAMTKTLSRDLAASGITVNSITPGVVETSPGFDEETRKKIEEMVPLGRVGVLEDIAYPVLFLASPMASYITGATIDVNGGILKR